MALAPASSSREIVAWKRSPAGKLAGLFIGLRCREIIGRSFYACRRILRIWLARLAGSLVAVADAYSHPCLRCGIFVVIRPFPWMSERYTLLCSWDFFGQSSLG